MERLGPYKIIRTIAMGGMGEVHLAALERAGGFEKQVALKCILPRLMTDARFVELFEREARLAAVLNHRNIVQVFDFGRDADRAWLAMEYVNGVDLKHVMERIDRIPLSIAIEIGISCARALHYAHRASDTRGNPLHIIHRDVSPQNILLSFEGDVKLADFGLAHAAARGVDTDGTLKGKFAYMSPEQATSRTLDERTDQFSLGVVLFELLSGMRAFHGNDGAEEILKRVASGRTHQPMSIMATEVPQSVRDCVQRAMSLDRRDRYADAGEFGHGLERAAQAADVTLGQPNIGDWLREVFPDRIPRRQSLNATFVEATAVAADPITLNPRLPVSRESTEFADTDDHHSPMPRVDVEGPEPESAQLPADLAQSQEDQGVVADPTAGSVAAERSVDSFRTGGRLFQVLLALGLMVFLGYQFFYETPPRKSKTPRQNAQVNSVESDATKGASAVLNSKGHDASSPVGLRASRRDAGASADQGAPLDGASTKIVDAAKAEDAAKAVDAKPVQTSGVVKSIKGIPKTDNRRRSRRNRARSNRRRSTQNRKAAARLAEVRLKKAPPSSSLKSVIGTVEPTGRPIGEGVAQSPKPADPQPVDVTPSKAKETIVGPRIRPVNGSAPLSIAGPKLGANWRAVGHKGILVRAGSKLGPKVTLRIYARGRRFHTAIHSKPFGKVELNGRKLGDTPVASAPLFEGRQTIRVTVLKGGTTTIKLEVAQ